jgi:hypothetical protein
MTDVERAEAVSKMGFTARQAAFLVRVALHSGVCLGRQYCTFAGLVWGQTIRDFFAALVARKVATTYPCARQGGRIYHLQHKALYRAIGEPDSRLRRPTPVPRAVERLMLLDAVLAQPELTWLATERDKLAYFTAHTSLPPDAMPRVVFRSRTGATTVRYFADHLPIGCHADGRDPVFLYLVRRWDSFDFRIFLQRHAPLLRALSGWHIRLLVPPHLSGAEERYRTACWNELATPLKPDVIDELRWYFERRNGLAVTAPEPDEQRYRQAHVRFSAPRFRALYKHWLALGDELLEFQGSHLVSEALKARRGRVDCHVLQRQYSHLSPLVGTV